VDTYAVASWTYTQRTATTSFPDVVLVPSVGDERDGSGGGPIPCHHEAGTYGCVRHDLLRRGQFWAFDARAAYRPARARGRRLVQRGITIKLADQGEVLTGLLAKPCGLAGTVPCVAYDVID
jgi:hypothetical protein